VADWNGDGKKDLLLGTEEGYVRFYPNRTSDTWPMFQDYTYVEAAGAPIYLYRVNPYIFDLDLDGRRDLLCGANDGYVRFYRNVGTNSAPVLAAPETLRLQDGRPILPIGTYQVGSRCGFGDWNNDGWPDMLLSGYDGYVQLHLGLPFSGIEERRERGQFRPERPTVVAAQGRRVVFPLPELAAGEEVTVTDVSGRVAAVSLVQDGGIVTWDCGGVAGVYFLRLSRAPVEILARVAVIR
jgi:hypothetical protein